MREEIEEQGALTARLDVLMLCSSGEQPTGAAALRKTSGPGGGTTKRMTRRPPGGGRQRLFTQQQELPIVDLVRANNAIRLNQLQFDGRGEDSGSGSGTMCSIALGVGGFPDVTVGHLLSHLAVKPFPGGDVLSPLARRQGIDPSALRKAPCPRITSSSTAHRVERPHTKHHCHTASPWANTPSTQGH
ncbi:unnamed protein product [Arctogadus glacialis]